MQSNTLKELYGKWQCTATPEQLAFVDSVYAMCEQHYEAGGDTIVECYGPEDILADFTSLEDVRRLCGLKVEQALNARWGEDHDPELERMRRCDDWIA